MRLADSWSPNRLSGAGSLMISELGDSHGTAGLRGSIQGFNNPDILHSLFARRFRFTVIQDAVREIQKLRSELIAFTDCFMFFLPVNS
jgi:hypothetical protein